MPGARSSGAPGDELGTALPLLPFLDALQVREPSVNARRNTIVGLLRGEIAADRGADVPATLAEQLLALVAEESAVRPVVLVIDDLQWADPASVTLWGRLARTARQAPLLLIGTARPVPHRDDLLALHRLAGDDGRIQLTGLADPAVADLVAVLAGGRPDGSLLRLAEGAAGNPLYLTELVAALMRGSNLTLTPAGTAALADGTDLGGQPGSSGPGSIPGSLSAVIADRLGFVTGPVRDVLRAAALLGVDFEISDLAIVLGRGLPELLPAVDEARVAGVLAESGSSLGFRHPMIRAALYEEMPAAVRAAWHRDAARALAAAGAPPERVARQLLCAADGSGAAEVVDERMLDWLVRTADQLRRPGARRRGGTARPGSRQHPVRGRPPRLAGEQARRCPVPHRRHRAGSAGSEPGARLRHRARPARRPALDARAVPHPNGPVRGIPGDAGPGAGDSWAIRQAPRQAAGGRRQDA